jgi:hypothetical protein
MHGESGNAAGADAVLSVDPTGQTNVDHAQLPIVPAGEPLAEHEVYIDVINQGHGPFRALPGQTAASGNGYVAERDVDPATWDLLVREDGEARLRREEEAEAARITSPPTEPASGKGA